MSIIKAGTLSEIQRKTLRSYINTERHALKLGIYFSLFHHGVHFALELIVKLVKLTCKKGFMPFIIDPVRQSKSDEMLIYESKFKFMGKLFLC